MTLQEFKSWFEGYTEEIGIPNKKQWERIKQRVSEIDDAVTSYPVFIDRYISPNPWPPVWSSASYRNNTSIAHTIASYLYTEPKQNTYGTATNPCTTVTTYPSSNITYTSN